jgi:hypothetical protein
MREMEDQLSIPKVQRQEREDIGRKSSINNSILKYILIYRSKNYDNTLSVI